MNIDTMKARRESAHSMKLLELGSKVNSASFKKGMTCLLGVDSQTPTNK